MPGWGTRYRMNNGELVTCLVYELCNMGSLRDACKPSHVSKLGFKDLLKIYLDAAEGGEME